jgi:phenylacetate-CoA ligase
MLNTQSIYQKLPTLFQNMAISLYGCYWRNRRFGGSYSQELKKLQEQEYWYEEQFVDYQNKELRKILFHALSTVPYYKEVFSKCGLSEEKIKEFNIGDLGSLPVLSKDELRKSGTTALVSEVKSKGRVYYGSSGSTGTPVQILYTHDLHRKMTAAMENRVRNWAGVTINDARGMIGGRRVVPDGESKGPFYRYNSFEKQVYLSAYHISAKHAMDYLEGMQKHNIKWMTGYAMSNYFLARFIEESGLKAPSLKAVITSSEKLTQEMRDTFSRVYGCRTFDSYSGVEACGLISECEHGSLHISPEIGIIELLDEAGNQVLPGEVGEAVCTGLLNYDQPLIRYRIGDRMRLSKNQNCSCGRHMPVIDEIIGRTEDTVIGLDGREMVRFHGIFIGMPNIIEGQLIQHTLSSFEIKVVVSSNLLESELNLMKSRMKSQLGEVQLDISVVDIIPRSENGKFQAVISHVKRSIDKV